MHRPTQPPPFALQVARAEGCWVFDGAKKRYLDLQTPHAALNFGHRHPTLVGAATAQLGRVHRTSHLLRAAALEPLTCRLAALCGAEAGELLTSRHEALRHVGQALRARAHGGAMAPILATGFEGEGADFVAEALGGPVRSLPFADVAALRSALREADVAGVVVSPLRLAQRVEPLPPDVLAEVAAACDDAGVPYVLDESSSGLGRLGPLLWGERCAVVPALTVLGHALGGGIVPVTAVVGREALLGPVRPHAGRSPLSGNALACSIAEAVVELLADGELLRHGQAMGRRLKAGLLAAGLPAIAELSGEGLWLSLALVSSVGPARPFCERLLAQGVLSIDVGGSTLQVAPALVVEPAEVDWAVERLVEVLGVPP